MRRNLLLAGLALAAVIVVWFVARGVHGGSAATTGRPRTPATAVAPLGAPASTSAAGAGLGAGPAGAAQPQGPVPAAVPDANAAGGGPGADERQDAKIARGLASNPEGGVLVQSTPPASVAGALRLQPGDVILTVDGVRISTPAEFVRLYREQGMPTELTIVRDGRELHLH